MPLIDDDDVVQTFAPDRADDAFDVGILPRRARCRADGRETEGFDGSTERWVEGRVAIVEEEPRVRVVGEGLAELLSGPGGRGVLRHIDMQDAPPVVSQDDEDEEEPAGERGHREEVDGDGRADMVLKECPPGLRGWRPPARHQPGDCPLRYLESQLQQLAVNARRAPERVRSGHLSRQASQAGEDLRTPAAWTRPSGPGPCEAAAMPGDDRGRSDDHQGRLPVWPRQPEADAEQPIGPANQWLRMGATVHRQLLPQRQVLEDETSMSARQGDQEPSDLDDTHDHGSA